jgi:hypothetical protein
VVLVFTALILTVMCGFAALVVDLGNARQQDRQAEASADAAALAAAQRMEDFGAQFTGSSAQWSAIVTDVKNYTFNNFGMSISAWEGCDDASALAFTPDSPNSNSCISADYAAWPAPGVDEESLTNRIRVQLPEHLVETGFAKAIEEDDLSISASAIAAVVRARTSVETVTLEEVAGGPCALCVLGTGLSLDGQNGDVTVTGGNVVVNSTAPTAAQLMSNGHVRITGEGAIGGPGAPANFSGSGFSPAPVTLPPVPDPLAHVPACGATTCPTNTGSGGTTLNPGVYTKITGSHTLSPGIYVIKDEISLSGNAFLQGDGVMIYLACDNYPDPCNPEGEDGARIKATGNGSMRITPPTAAQCTVNAMMCPYVGMAVFADRNNTSVSTYRGNGTNENGLENGGAGTFYMKRGGLDLRGNGFTLQSLIVIDRFIMDGNPSGVTIAYDLADNVPVTHTIEVRTGTTAYSYDSGGLVG